MRQGNDRRKFGQARSPGGAKRNPGTIDRLPRVSLRLPGLLSLRRPRGSRSSGALRWMARAISGGILSPRAETASKPRRPTGSPAASTRSQVMPNSPRCRSEAGQRPRKQRHRSPTALGLELRMHLRSNNHPCLSGCHPQPLAVVFGHAHGRSPAWQSSVPTIAPRVPATFSRRRGLRRLPGEGSLERRVCLPPLSGGGRAVPLRKSSWRLALPQVPP